MSDRDSNPPATISRDFTVATFIVHERRVLLLWHRKIQKWLPPGGHLEPNELPDEAATREVREETGLSVELIGEPGLPIDAPRQLVRPYGIQLEDIQPGHQHIDLIYFARPTEGSSVETIGNDESEMLRWCTLDDMPSIGVVEEVKRWADRAIQEVEPGSPRASSASAR
ncbi:MAG: NUDIX hydrolase [Chloroflexota bacterium]